MCPPYAGGTRVSKLFGIVSELNWGGGSWGGKENDTKKGLNGKQQPLERGWEG